MTYIQIVVRQSQDVCLKHDSSLFAIYFYGVFKRLCHGDGQGSSLRLGLDSGLSFPLKFL